MRRYEGLTAAGILALAAIAMRDSFPKAAWGATGPGAGFYPFWSAAMMAAAAFFVLIACFRMPAGGSLFASSQGPGAVAKLLVPMIVAVALINGLGFYIVSGAYMAIFARWIGGYGWRVVAGVGLGIPVALYLGFERGFRVPLPKSVFYGDALYDHFGLDLPIQLPF